MATAGTSHRCSTKARDELFVRFCDRIECNPRLDRSLVSFQANRASPIFKWFKYKEGFSARLVEYLLEELGLPVGTILDPFAGTGTALFAARERGWNAVGIELLPVGWQVMEAISAVERIKPSDFVSVAHRLFEVDLSSFNDPQFAMRHIAITRGAFPAATERAIAGYRSYCHKHVEAGDVRLLLDFAGLSILEEVSYTRKDGQYLRWDSRTPSRTIRTSFDKGRIPSFATAIRAKLHTMCDDLTRRSQRALFDDHKTSCTGKHTSLIDVRRGSCLELLPQLQSESIDLVITSPPYCNRYDYTRTYALELVYLGCTAEDVKRLRQQMLSCTVENQEKEQHLRTAYARLHRSGDFERVDKVFSRQAALFEVLSYLSALGEVGSLNNANIPRMVRNYFFEMCFVVYELARVLRPGGRVVIVNDNVRYAGEELPVDLILSAMAEEFGLCASRIWTLPRGKGNSSQQMGDHGRKELRKCVYLWEKGGRSVRKGA